MKMMEEKGKAAERFLKVLFAAAAIFIGFESECVKAERAMPQNPVHHCSKDDEETDYNGERDTTDWSYVYFGSYPQSEVTGTALTPEITGADFDADGDAWVNGTKYRRIYHDDTETESYSWNNECRYFKWERIKWRVLKNDGNTLFVMADQALDGRRYNVSEWNASWKTSTLRDWLNDGFYRTAFSSKEQNAIVEQTIDNENETETKDNVYLLSLEEVTNSEYGFCNAIYGDESKRSASRIVKKSEYARACGVDSDNTISYSGEECCWWLRTSDGSDHASLVYTSGMAERNGQWTYTVPGAGCVPVLHISLSSDYWYTADDGSSGDGGSGVSEKTPNPAHHCTKKDDGTDQTDWKYVYFGTYPQRQIGGSLLTSEIINASYDTNGDAWVNGTKYRRVIKSQIKKNIFSDNNAYCYFKWEPIRWRVLEDNGSTLFVIADQGLYANSLSSDAWVETGMRKWLNEDFYKEAFSSSEQTAITEQNVTHDKNPFFYTHGGNDTKDKVFLLSIEEARNPAYGFCENHRVHSVSRQIKPSIYAYANGADASISYSKGNYEIEATSWWLRTPGKGEKSASLVNKGGYIEPEGNDFAGNINMIVPALHIDRASNAWSWTDDTNKVTNFENINKPKATSIKGKLKPRKKGILIKWKKQTNITGYKIQISASKKFTKKKTITKTIKKASTTKLSVGKLKAKKKYYVRIRTYRKVNNKNIYSPWSKIKNVKTK